jgi:hypothetical protein
MKERTTHDRHHRFPISRKHRIFVTSLFSGPNNGLKINRAQDTVLERREFFSADIQHFPFAMNAPSVDGP